jgi:hypothetical protein
VQGEFGTLDQVGGAQRLTFVRRLAHPPARVWTALTEPDHLAAWFPAAIEGDRAAGAKLPEPCRPDGLLESDRMRQVLAAHGRSADCVVIEAPTALRTSGWLPSPPWSTEFSSSPTPAKPAATNSTRSACSSVRSAATSSASSSATPAGGF